MSFLLDTNVISEIAKGPRCDPNVSRWYADLSEDELYLSTLVLGEIRKGIEKLRLRQPARALALEHWLTTVASAFSSRIIGIDVAVADQWGRMNAARSIPVVDGLLVATALVHGLTLATRNERDVEGVGASILNPFRAPA